MIVKQVNDVDKEDSRGEYDDTVRVEGEVSTITYFAVVGEGG